MADVAPTMDDCLLEELYSWIDEIPLSRPKKDIKRDFSDAVLVAEVVHHYIPRLVELHNYVPANKVDNKLTNWKLMNRKVFKKLGFELGDDVIRNVASCTSWSIEQTLMLLRRKIDRFLFEEQRSKKGDKTDRSNEHPEADQDVSSPLSNQQQQQSHVAKARPDHKYQQGSDVQGSSSQSVPGQPTGHGPGRGKYRGDMVPKVLVEEKEQDILSRDETIQILQAKVRRLEHLLHLKDIRIDDLQGRMERLEMELKPTSLRGRKWDK